MPRVATEFQKPNHLSSERTDIYVPTNMLPWTRENRPKTTGIRGGAGNGFLTSNKKLVSAIFALS